MCRLRADLCQPRGSAGKPIYFLKNVVKIARESILNLQICAAVCRSGCACDEGYVRSKRGMCVLPEDCRYTVYGRYDHCCIHHFRAIDLINGDHGNHTISIVG